MATVRNKKADFRGRLYKLLMLPVQRPKVELNVSSNKSWAEAEAEAGAWCLFANVVCVIKENNSGFRYRGFKFIVCVTTLQDVGLTTTSVKDVGHFTRIQ